MLSREGVLLCYTDLARLKWYVGKGIAEWVGGDVPAIRLLFDHQKGDQAAGVDAFYSDSKVGAKRTTLVYCPDTRAAGHCQYI